MFGFITIPYELDRQVFITKLFRKPLQAISDKVDAILAGKESQNDLKYIMYSAHDDNIANAILFFQPYNYYLSYVPFASSMLFELHFDD